MKIILSIVIIVVMCVIVKHPSYTAHNRENPPDTRINWNQITIDRVNGMSQRDIDLKFNAGGYDISDKK